MFLMENGLYSFSVSSIQGCDCELSSKCFRSIIGIFVYPMEIFGQENLVFGEVFDFASFAERPEDAAQNSDSLSRIPSGSEPPEGGSTLDGFAVLRNPSTDGFTVGSPEKIYGNRLYYL